MLETINKSLFSEDLHYRWENIATLMALVEGFSTKPPEFCKKQIR
jgi:hypothetical protein